MKWECPVCGKVYDARGLPEYSAPPMCSGGQRHNRATMRPRDEYQCTLDDLGIPLDDPLRLA
jgi:hypothetical protein